MSRVERGSSDIRRSIEAHATMGDDDDDGFTDPRPGLQPGSSGTASDTRWSSMEARPGAEESGAGYVPFQSTPEHVAAGVAEGGMSKSIQQVMDDSLLARFAATTGRPVRPKLPRRLAKAC